MHVQRLTTVTLSVCTSAAYKLICFAGTGSDSSNAIGMNTPATLSKRLSAMQARTHNNFYVIVMDRNG